MSSNGTERTEGSALDPKGLITLSDDDEISVVYQSVYSDEPQTLTGVVGGVYKHKSQSEPITWFEIPLKPSDEVQLRSRKRECYREHEHLRRLSGYIHQEAGVFVTVEALNGGRWHNITGFSSDGPEITICRVDARNDCTQDTDADHQEVDHDE